MRGFRLKKPGFFSRNHCEMAIGTTSAGVELQNVITTAVDEQTSGSVQMPANSILTRMRVELWATDTTPVTGKHQCLMLHQPGATTYTTPLASYFSGTWPRTEEAIQVRQNAMGRRGVETLVTITGHDRPPHFVCFWRGRKLMRDGDDVVLVNLDGTATTWTAVCDYTWIE